jgi:adenylate cyclase, class 2
MLATGVTIPEIDGTVVELETLTNETGVDAALGDVRAVLGEPGIGEDDLTTEQYTDAVMRARA